MRFAPRPGEEPEINLISLVDVVFMLLIFFMVTTTFVRATGLKITLPRAEQAVAPEKHDAVEITVDAAGRYFVNGRPLRDGSSLTLARGLSEVAGEDHGGALIIRADGRVSHQAVVTVMDVAGRAGFNQISIATVPAP